MPNRINKIKNTDIIISQKVFLYSKYSENEYYIKNLYIAQKGFVSLTIPYCTEETDKKIYFMFRHNSSDMLKISKNIHSDLSENTFFIPLINLKHNTIQYIHKSINPIKIVDEIIKDLEKNNLKLQQEIQQI